MKEVRLNNGVMMPSVGFGVYQMAKSETKQAVLQALEVGYRMIDTAASYFNEREVGEACRELQSAKSPTRYPAQCPKRLK